MRRVYTNILAAYLYLPFVILMVLYPNIAFFREISFALMLIPSLLVFLGRKTFPKRYLVYFAYLGIKVIVGLHASSLSRCLKDCAQDLVYFTPIFIFDTIQSIQDVKEKKKIGKKYFVIISILFGYCIIRSCLYSLTDPYAIRHMATYDVGEQPEGVPFAIGGGYPLIFALILLVPFWMYVAKKNHKTKTELYVSLLAVALSIMLLISSSVTTAVLITFLAVIFVLLLGKKRSFYVIVLAGGILTIVLLSNKSFLLKIINIVSGFFDRNSIIYIRLQEVVPALFDGNTTSAFGVRLESIQLSLNTFFKYPIVGAGYHVGYNYYDLLPYVGQHCEWIDLFAQYGGVIAVLILTFLKSSTNLLRKSCNIYIRPIFSLLILIYYVVGFFDPIINTNMLLVLFVYVPSFIWKDNQKIEPRLA